MLYIHELAGTWIYNIGSCRMANYTHLSMVERCRFNCFLSMKLKIGEIAKRMDRHPSTLYRELNRNTKYGVYLPSTAHRLAHTRHPHPPNKLDVHAALNNYVIEKLHLGWTPEEIAGRMRLDKLDFYICAESIYRYIYRNKHLGLYKLLPSKQPKRRPFKVRKTHQKSLLPWNISKRPPEVDERLTSGHWEGDTIRFQKIYKACVTTLVERTTRYVFLKKNIDGKTKNVINGMVSLMLSTPKKLWSSMTLDLGMEFMCFREIERKTKCDVWFCNPSSPWQRGSNENTNGRLRRFLPRNIDIDQLPEKILEKIASQMNDTPRKCLGYRTPREMLIRHWKRLCRTSL